jgi:hypothetical protein
LGCFNVVFQGTGKVEFLSPFVRAQKMVLKSDLFVTGKLVPRVFIDEIVLRQRELLVARAVGHQSLFEPLLWLVG